MQVFLNVAPSEATSWQFLFERRAADKLATRFDQVARLKNEGLANHSKRENDLGDPRATRRSDSDSRTQACTRTIIHAIYLHDDDTHAEQSARARARA